MYAHKKSVFGQMAVIADMAVRRSPANFSMPAYTIREMEIHGIDKAVLERLFGSHDSIVHLYEKNGALDHDQTDRAVRVIRIVDLAEKVFRNSSKAMAWLNRYNDLLEAKPVEMLAREAGANLVEETLLRINYSVVA